MTAKQEKYTEDETQILEQSQRFKIAEQEARCKNKESGSTMLISKV